jgi:putative hydrolases of HD superfamily
MSTIKRSVSYFNDHWENDAEHSYQVAMAAWAADDQYALQLDHEKLLKMALVHDLVEVYAGDTDSFAPEEVRAQKVVNEHNALEKIKSNFPDLTEIHALIEDYETKSSLESKVINIVDKIIPVLHDYKTNSEYYKDRKISVEKYEAWLLDKSGYEALPESLKKIVDDALADVKNTYKNVFYVQEV